MNTIKIYLAESGRIAELKKDFPLFQGQYQNKLLNVYVPTSIMAPDFTAQTPDGVVTAEYVASTSLKIGMSYTARDGSIKVSRNYYMRFLKTLTYQNVEYAMYERRLPKEFTLYAGQGANAPVLTANVVNILNETEEGTMTVLSVTSTQTCSLDVMPSTPLDADETIEPSELEIINGELNSINSILPTKQDKIDETLETTNKSVVGAINENKDKIDINTQSIETNRQDIAQNRNSIDFLLQNAQMSEDYIGQLRGTTLPQDTELTQFVFANTIPNRNPKNGDVVIFILEIQGETDKNYRYFYTATGWQGYEIPPLETASNGTLGIIEGTYGVGNSETLVDISGGQILNIYVKDDTNTYRNIREYLNTTTTNILNIINGNTSVGNALRAVADGVGNNIVNTYLTQTLGATKQYVRDYAMPREFNDVFFIYSGGYQDSVPVTPAGGVQFSAVSNAVGDFTLFQITKENNADFELSSKNGYSNNIYVSSSIDCRVSFRLTTQYRKIGGDWEDLNIELTSPYNLSAGDVEKLDFASPFNSLEENVISLTEGDLIRQTLEVITQTSTPITFYVYSNSTYPSTFNLTSQSYVLSGIEQAISRLIMLGADGIIEANRVVFEVQNADSYLEFRTNQREFLINGHLPIVGALDDALPVNITFGDTTYNVYSYMKGSATPITIGDLKSNMTYNQAIGYSFTSKMIFLETSDYVGFVISPATITAEQLSQIIEDTETVVVSLNSNGTKMQFNVAPAVLNRIMKTLVTPMSAPLATELVAVDNGNSQTMLSIGTGLYIQDGELRATGGSGDSSGTVVLVNGEPQETWDADTKVGFNDYASGSQAGIIKIGTGLSVTGGNTVQIQYASETQIEQRSTYRYPITPIYLDLAVKTGVTTNTISLTDQEKTSAQNWLGVPSASALNDYMLKPTPDAGGYMVIPKVDYDGAQGQIKVSYNPLQYALVAYTTGGVINVNTPTSNLHATNKQYVDGIASSLAGQNEYIGRFSGSSYTSSSIQTDLTNFVANNTSPSRSPRTGDLINIVNAGSGVDYSGQQWRYEGNTSTWAYYIDFENHSVINNLTSTSTTDGLSALQGKNLNDMITTLSGELGDTQQDVADNMTAIGVLQGRASSLETADGQNVKLTGNQSIGGTKTFTGTIIVPDITIS